VSLCALVSTALAPGAAAAAIEDSVVKVFSTSRLPDLFKPWTKQAPRDATGSGVIIEGRRVLTNAHVVLYANQVQVQANESGDKVSATVEAIAPGIDLAVLKLDDETLFDKRPPLPRAAVLPDVKDPVLVYGYPTGGTNLSITKGIISRIEFTPYNYSTSGLRIQIDAAINPGNSGGPALSGDKMVGLAFSRLGGGENIGYIIPCEEIELFLLDIKDGRYDGKPAMFDALQTFENPALRPYLKLDKGVEGMIVTLADVPDASYPLKPWDVITKIGDTPIDNEGQVRLGANLRVRFQYLIQKIAKNGRVPLTVVRAGKPMQVELPVSPTRPMLVPSLEGTYPPYFVYGPLCFSPATQDFVGGFNMGWLTSLTGAASPLATRRSDRPRFEGEQLVVVTSPFFPHKLSKGYSPAVSQVVRSINGTTVKNLLHLVELLRDAKDPYVVVEFYGRAQETLVFPRAEMVAATEDILSDNGVRAQGSADTLAVWTKQPSKPGP
jgi:S1-C subfamily serine protease